MFKVDGETSSFDAAMNKVQGTRDKIENQRARHSQAAKKDSLALQQAADKRKRAEADLAAEQAKGGKANIAALKALQKEVQKLKDAEARLKLSTEANEMQRRAAFQKTANALKQQEAEVERMQSAATKIKNFGAGIGGMVLGGVSLAAFKKLAGELDAIAKRARDIGLSASGLFELQHQAKLAGVDVSKLDVSLKALDKNRNLAARGTGEQAKAFESLGISIKSADGAVKSSKDLMIELSDAAQKGLLDSGTASRLFGDNALEMTRILQNGGDVLREAFNSDKIDEAAAAAERFQDIIENASHKAMPEIYNLTGKIITGFEEMASLAGDTLEAYDVRKGLIQALREGAEKTLTDQMNAESERLNRQREQQELQIPILTRIRDTKKEIAELEKLAIQGGDETYLAEDYEAMADGLRRKMSKWLPEYEAHQKKVSAAIAKSNEAVSKSYFNSLGNQEKLTQITEEMRTLKKEIAELDRESEEYAEKYNELAKKKAEYIKTQKALETEKNAEEKKAADERAKALKEYEAKQKKIADEAARAAKAEAAKLAAMEKAHASFEQELEIAAARATGDSKLEKQLQFEKMKTEYMEKQGLSAEQAEKAARAMQEIQNADKTEYSAEAKEKAQKVLDRKAAGKSVGTKELADAQAIIDGKDPEGGLQSGRFKKYQQDPKSGKIRDAINDYYASTPASQTKTPPGQTSLASNAGLGATLPQMPAPSTPPATIAGNNPDMAAAVDNKNAKADNENNSTIQKTVKDFQNKFEKASKDTIAKIKEIGDALGKTLEEIRSASEASARYQ